MATLNDLLTTRVPPHSLEAERAVLGGMIIEPAILAKCLTVLRPEDFYLERHRKLMTVMSAMFLEGLPVDLVTLTERLQRTKDRSSSVMLEDIGGQVVLAELAEEAAAAIHTLTYADLIMEKATLRSLIQLGSQMVGYGYEQETSTTIIDKIERGIVSLTDRKSRGGVRTMRDLLGPAFEQVERLASRQEAVTGVPSGFPDLDRLTSGWQPEDLILLAGRPSMGKTAFALTMAAHASIHAEKRVLIFSLEMSKEQLVNRLLCSTGRVDAHKLRTGMLSPFDYERLNRAAGQLSDAPLFVDDSAGLTPMEIRAKARRHQVESGLDLVVIDYLQLMRAGQTRHGNRQEEISEISRLLKSLAKELGIPVIALSQLSRAVESREKKEPQLSDLRESGSLEQDADVVMFLYRPDRYGIGMEDQVIVGKQRNGPVGRVDVTFLSEYTLFTSRSLREDPDAAE